MTTSTRFCQNTTRFIVISLFAAINAAGQGVISTIAGGGAVVDNIPAIQARITGLSGLAVDPHGNAYISDDDGIRRIDSATGIISTVAAGVKAQTLALDPSGNIILSSSNQLLRLNSVTGTISPIIGGQGTSSSLGSLFSFAADTAGNIFTTDQYNCKIYRIDAKTGALTTLAGSGSSVLSQGNGGPATLASLVRPTVITLDPSGNIFFAEQSSLRRIDAKTGIITAIMPLSSLGTGTDGNGGSYSSALLSNVTALTTDSKGNLYIADRQYVRQINWSTGIITGVALSANLSGSTDSLAVDAAGTLWITDYANARLFAVSAATGLIKTVAGTSPNGDGGPASSAVVNASGLAINTQGDIYLVSGVVRRIDHLTGFISTVASALTLGNTANPISLDVAGNIYLSATATVQRIDPKTAVSTTVAGNGTQGPADNVGDGGPALNAPVNPAGVAIDLSGNLYIADYGNARIRRVDAATGIITTVAGTGKGQTFSGLTGVATQIAIGVPTSIAIGPEGNVYWTTSGSILKLDSAGLLSVAAGQGGGCVYAGDGGPARSATLCQPSALAFDNSANLFVSEGSCACIRRVDAKTGIIQTVAGTGTLGTSADGLVATRAAINPSALAVFGGILYFGDAFPSAMGRVRTVTPAIAPPLTQPPSITQVVDAIDYRTDFSPGSIVSIFGNYLGPQTPLAASIGPNGLFPSTLGGGQVLFNNIQGPVLYSSAGQINAVVPYATATAPLSTQVINALGTNTYSGGFYATPTSLSFFPGLVFNPDGTLNGPSNPAPSGATLVFYGTGMGRTIPAAVDGSIVTGPPFPVPVASFVATVQNGGTRYKAAISYLGPLPGFIAGTVQANIQMPANLPAGASTLSVSPTDSSPGTAGQTIYLLPSNQP